MSDTYRINEVFYSVQGEGVRVGTANVFIRFTGCNMQCSMEPGPKSPGGFDCDTEFESGRDLTLKQLDDAIDLAMGDARPMWVTLTGGEPGLQVDHDLTTHLSNRGFMIAIETNGSVYLTPGLLDFITVSPKVAEHAIRQTVAHEVKYVRGHGQAIPKTKVNADHYLISPAFNGMEPDPRALDWCVQLVKDHPQWRLTPQLHKLWNAR